MMTISLAQTPLHDWHAAHDGRMVEFGGWSMPVQYSGIVAEHHATRRAAGLFDISHMGRLRFDGADAAHFLDSLITRRVLDMQPGQVRYALVTNHDGGILDDVLVYRVQDAVGGTYHLLVVNASNRLKILDWIASHQATSTDTDVTCTDLTSDWAMIAVQGPLALRLAQPLVEAELESMKYYTATETSIAGHGGIVSRTGYTGEDGCELIVGAAVVEAIWSSLLESGQAQGVVAAGLGSRDTLRLEAGMPLYGHELSAQTNPFQAGLGFAVNLKDRTFTGHDALVQAKEDATQLKRVGLELIGRRIAREGCTLLVGDGAVGQVTSGTFSPTLEKSIAMGYVQPDLALPGTELAVDIRGRREVAHVVPLPFYRR